MSSDSFEWGYTNENGPHTWAKHFPNASGARQSPILINTALAKKDEKLLANPLTITINESGSQTVTNTGTGFRVDINSEKITISGGPLESGDVYRIAQFHFHWGQRDDWGSEHTIDGRAFASELHCVFWNSRYGSVGEAAAQEDGLAVLGSLIEVGCHNDVLDALTCELGKIPCKDDRTTLCAPVVLENVLPSNVEEYYTYKGSLTTPPCNESVTWFVFKEPITMSAEQLNAFRGICCGGKDSEAIVDNFRPPCPLGSRSLNCSF